ncbi:unnamed protein product [Trichobilharzia szidati]|nr:unnamed protein product [Trichobilharzia szidati]
MPPVCLIEFDSNASNVSLCPTNVPQDTIYPLPVDKGEVYVGTATASDKLHSPNMVCLPSSKWPDIETYHIMFWLPKIAVDKNKKTSEGWLACRPCLLASSRNNNVNSQNSTHKITEVYLNNHLLTIPLTSNYQETVFWLKSGDVLRLGKGARQLKVWSYLELQSHIPTGLHTPQMHDVSSKDIHDDLAQNCRIPESPTIVGISNLYALNDTTLTNSNVSPQCTSFSAYLNVLPHINTFSPERVMSQAMYPDDLKCSERLMKLSLTKGKQNNLSNGLCPLANPNSICDSSSSSLSSCTSASETVSSDSTTSSLKVLSPTELSGQQHHRMEAYTNTNFTQSLNCVSNKSNTTTTTTTTAVATTSTTITTTTPINKKSCMEEGFRTSSRNSEHDCSRSTVCQSPPSFRQGDNSVSAPSQKLNISSLVDTQSHLNNSLSSEHIFSPNHSHCSSLTKDDHTYTKGSSNRTKSVSDRLPCQMAFAPITLEQLLDWIIIKQLKYAYQTGSTPATGIQSDVTIDLCPLGPAMSVYLMLRAICRQCDRWEAIEFKQLAKSSSKGSTDVAASNNPENVSSHVNRSSVTSLSELTLNQSKRRQRQLLALLVSALDRYQNFEVYVSESIKSIDLSNSVTCLKSNCHQTRMPSSPQQSNEKDNRLNFKFISLIKSVTVWLANSSQLLHLITCDVDLNAAFKSPVIETFESKRSSTNNEKMLNAAAQWDQLKEQLAEIVQTAFVYLADLCVLCLDLIAIPQLLIYLTECVKSLSDTHQHLSSYKKTVNCTESAEVTCKIQSNNTSAIDGEDDMSATFHDHCKQSEISSRKHNITIDILSEILDCLHSSHVNPAFIVQLFAHLLHRLNARLFNFVIGYNEKENKQTDQTHVSPLWGSCLYAWIHNCLGDWATEQGLSLATECYLQRISQAADLMLCNMKSVESLYNMAVDLVSLNSRQVRALLESYRLHDGSSENETTPTTNSNTTTTSSDKSNSGQIPKAWIEFVVSGVKLVADRILTEESMSLTNDDLDEMDKNTTIPDSGTKSKPLELGEPLDLHLPFLLPEDCYPSDNPLPVVGQKEESLVSYDDSGVCSRSSSTKDQKHQPSSENVSTPVITVESIKHFLNPAIQIGWCRISMKSSIHRVDNTSTSVDETLSDRRMSISQNPTHFLRWNVYLIDPKSSVDCESVKADTIKSDEHVTLSVNPNTESVQCANQTQAAKIVTTSVTLGKNNESLSNRLSSSSSLLKNHSVFGQLCSRHCTYSVVVPKIGQSLGLSIVAARSEYGQDLGIYVRGINPGSGASHARLLQRPNETHVTKCNEFLLTPPYLQTGDRLISVNGQLITGLSQDAAVQLVSSATCEVVLTVIRYAKQNDDDKNKTMLLQSSQKTSDLKQKTTNLQCIDCLLHESLLLNYKAFIDSDEKSSSHLNEDSTQRMVNPSTVINSQHESLQSTITTATASLSTTSVKQLSPSQRRAEAHIHDVHIDMKLSIDTSYPKDRYTRWKYQSNTVDRSIHNKVPVGVNNLPNNCTPLSKDRSLSTNERQFRLYIDASSCNSSSNIYDEPSISDYSLCAESFLSNSKLEKSGVRMFSPTIVDSSHGHSEQNSLPTKPCHRPKGQSVSFDDRLSTPRYTQLPETMVNAFPNDGKSVNQKELTSPRLLINSSSAFCPQSAVLSAPPNQSFSSSNIVSATTNEFMQTSHIGSSMYRPEVNCLEGCNIYSPSDVQIKQCSPNCMSVINPHQDHHRSSTPSCFSTTTSPNQSSTLLVGGGSKPPKTFVPTVCVLPVSNRGPVCGAPPTIKARNSRDCLDSYATNSRASRSMNDLVTKSSYTDIPQAKTTDVNSITVNRHTGCPVRRRYTTFTTSRFNVGPRPEPLNRSLVKQTQFT